METDTDTDQSFESRPSTASSQASVGKEREKDAFLLYNDGDRDQVAEIDRHLRERGITTWYSRESLRLGDEWESLEQPALEGAATVVVFLGGRGWGPTQQEWMQRALRLRKRILPVLVDSPPPEALEAFDGFFRRHHWIKFDSPSDPKALAGLVKGIRGGPRRSTRRQFPNVDQFVSTIVNGSDDDRFEALGNVINSLESTDHTRLRRRVVEEITQRFSGVQSDPALAARHPNQIPSIRSWLLSTLAWICGDDTEAFALLQRHLNPDVERVPAVRFWTLASLFESRNGISQDALLLAAHDPSEEVALLAAAIRLPEDPVGLSTLRTALQGSSFSVVWPALRALRIVPIPELIGDLCSLLGRELEGPVPYDALLALAHPGLAPMASDQLINTYGVDRTLQFVLNAARGSSRRSVSIVARILQPVDRELVDRALAKVPPSSEFYDTVRILRRVYSDTASGAAPPPVLPGYATDNSGKLQDQLDLHIEIETLCSVMLATDVKPPVSIGLFGDWGTGKSFFMDLMRAAVERKASASAKPGSKFHTQVAQITFNAWHYVDANLWASLMSHILEELSRKIQPQEDPLVTRKELVGRLEIAKEMREEAVRERDRAVAARAKIEASLLELAKARAEKQVELNQLRATDLWSLIRKDPDLKQQIEDALKALGLPAFRSGIVELEAAVSEARTVVGRGRALLVSFTTNVDKKLLVGIVLLLLVGFPLLAWGLKTWLFPGAPLLTAVSAGIGQIVGVMTGVVALIRQPLVAAKGYLEQLEKARDTAVDLIASTKAQQSQAEVDLEKDLTAMRAKEESSAQELVAATVAIREIEARISEIDEGRSLAKFLLQRVQTDDYRKQLGIVSMIRRDFEKLSELLHQPRFGIDGSPIERIILYIDDLDRCPAARVCEVLQAVHLLLAFDLFIVVVGVDPRWVLHSLQEIYPAFKGAPANGAPAGENWLSTPQNYLEKIFQIPFALRPMGETGFGSLVRSLLPEATTEANVESEPSLAPETPDQPPNPPETSEAPKQPAKGQGDVGNVPLGPKVIPVQPAAQLSHVDPLALTIHSWEQDFAARLHGLISTPRATKRFTNIYRLIKAPLTGERLKRFQGTKAAPGDFRAAMLLLAILTGFPELADRLFARIAGETSEDLEPGDLFDSLATVGIAEPVASRFRNGIRPLLADGLTDTIGPYVEWVPAVSRFSFRSVGASPRIHAASETVANDS